MKAGTVNFHFDSKESLLLETRKFVANESEHLPEQIQNRWIYYTLFPNTFFDLYPDQIDFMQMIPLGQGNTGKPLSGLDKREASHVTPSARTWFLLI